MTSLADRFGLHWLNDTESAPFVRGMQKAQSEHLSYPIDMQCLDFMVCKLGRVIRREDKQTNKGNGVYLTYVVP